MLSQDFILEMKNKLLASKAQFEQELSELKPHVELGNDMDSDIQEVQEDEVNQDVIAKLRMDLEKIEKALSKIENGGYGLDDDGKEISEERLKILPWADKAI